jgi:hypothetical protein
LILCAMIKSASAMDSPTYASRMFSAQDFLMVLQFFISINGGF